MRIQAFRPEDGSTLAPAPHIAREERPDGIQTLVRI